MGKEHRKGRKRSRDERRDSGEGESSDEESTAKASLKLLKYSSQGRTQRVKRLLKRRRAGIGVTDSEHRTALHLACAGGHEETSAVLLRYGASLGAQDAQGSTPLHAACLLGHWPLAMRLLQRGAVDVDVPSHAGVTVRALVERYLAAQQAQAQAQAQQVSERVPPAEQPAPNPEAAFTTRRASASPAPSAPGAASASSSDYEDVDEAKLRAYEKGGGRPVAETEARRWQQKLREAAGWEGAEGVIAQHHGEEVLAASGRGAWAPGPMPPVAWGQEEEDDDAWADRLWSEMQQRRRRAAADASRLFGAALRQDAEKRAAAEAAAASRSARILEEERAKDAAWRRRAAGALPALPPGAGGAAGAVLDVGAQRAAYEAGWARLDALLAAGQPPPAGLTQADIPWPSAGEAMLGVEAYRALVLHGVESAADVKRRMRTELLRWHPDKFEARIPLAALERERVLARARGVAQIVTQLLAGVGAAGGS